MNRSIFLPSLILSSIVAAQPSYAAQVELFGFLDQGFAYLSEDLNKGMGGPVGQSKPQTLSAQNKVAAQGAVHNYTQGTGNVSTWGIRGTETINDDLSIVFHLESAFLPDDGTIYGAGSPLFEREASVGVRSKQWGELKAGRMPALSTGSGTTGLFNSRVNPFGAGWGNMTGGWKYVGTLATARWNNMIHYSSPVWQGWRVFAQHSFGNTNDTTEGTSDTNRWTALGLTWSQDRVFLASSIDWLRAANNSTNMAKDTWKFLLGGHLKMDSWTLYGTFQYLKNTQYLGGYSTKEFAPVLPGQKLSKGFDSWALSTGVDVPMGHGTFKASLGYGAGENQNLDHQNEFQRINVGLGYVYPLSRRTSVYAIGGYFWQDADWQSDDIHAHEAIVGLMHRF